MAETAETAAIGGGGGAGASDIGLVAQAATAYFDVVKDLGGKVLSAITAPSEFYRERLRQQGVPQIHDWFAGYKTDFTDKNRQIIILLIAVILIFGIAAMFIGKK